MSDHQIYRDLIAELGMSQNEAARFLDVNERTSRRWASGDQPVPAAVLMLLNAMLEVGLPPDQVRRIIGPEPHPIPRT